MEDINTYNQNISNTLQNLNYVKDNASNVYGSDELQKKYDVIKHNEESAVTDYKNSKNLVMNEKVNNWKNLLSVQNDLNKTESQILDKSNQNFSKEFNENMVKLNYINNEITTKNKIILMNQYTSETKELTVRAMKSIILYLVLMVVPLFLTARGFVRPLYGYGAILISGLITFIVVFIQFRRDGESDMLNIINKGKETSTDMARTFIKDVFPKSLVHKCPKKCRPYNPSEEEETPPEPSYDYNHGNEVYLDDSMNKWTEGDVPTIGATLKGFEKIRKGVEPKPYYEGDKHSPTYVCRWKYDPTKMTNMNKGLVFHTKIPCEFFPGYETIAKK